MPTQDTEFATTARPPREPGEEALQRRLSEERAAVAREIHDEVGGALAALRFDLAWLARHATETQMQQRLHQATDTLQKVIAATQRIALELRPPALDDGLLAALQDLTDRFQQRADVQTTLRATHDIEELSQAVQHVVYRTVQEALTNVGKHAGCRQVAVALSLTPEGLRLTIEDDGIGIGIGISPSSLEQPERLGLRGMRERAEAMGGAVDVGLRQGGGTTVVLTLPVERSFLNGVSDTSAPERSA